MKVTRSIQEVITATDAGVRAVVFSENTGTFGFQVERKCGPEVDDWEPVSLELFRSTDTAAVGIIEADEAVNRACSFLASAIMYYTHEDHREGLGLCLWFARCDRAAVMLLDHPILGQVPTCQRCADKDARLSG